MEENKSVDAEIVESAGETVAAATGPAEIGAAAGKEDENHERPVGADTRVKVEGEDE